MGWKYNFQYQVWANKDMMKQMRPSQSLNLEINLQNYCQIKEDVTTTN